MDFVAAMASFGAADGKKKSFKINKMPRMAQMTGQNGGAGILARMKAKKKVKMKCKWNVNKPYRNVNQKTKKSPKRHDARQFTHSSTALHYYYIYLYIFILIIKDYHSPACLFAVFRPFCCYSVPLHVNCYADVTSL